MQLTKGMYGYQLDPNTNLFGLHCGQMRYRPEKITHNSGWYNRAGEKLGWGDLCIEDFQCIAQGLDKNELFIVLSEADSGWNFETHYKNTIGNLCGVDEAANAPGIDYVATHAMYAIAPKQLYVVSKQDHGHEKYLADLYQASFRLITPEALKERMIAPA